jgi:hypothetical protein
MAQALAEFGLLGGSKVVRASQIFSHRTTPITTSTSRLIAVISHCRYNMCLRRCK